jgi:hypothetical protein
MQRTRRRRFGGRASSSAADEGPSAGHGAASMAQAGPHALSGAVRQCKRPSGRLLLPPPRIATDHCECGLVECPASSLLSLRLPPSRQCTAEAVQQPPRPLPSPAHRRTSSDHERAAGDDGADRRRARARLPPTRPAGRARLLRQQPGDPGRPARQKGAGVSPVCLQSCVTAVLPSPSVVSRTRSSPAGSASAPATSPRLRSRSSMPASFTRALADPGGLA